MFVYLEQVKNGEPMMITNNDDMYVVMDAIDYKALQETIYILSDPVTRKSIVTPPEDELWFDERELAWNSGR